MLGGSIANAKLSNSSVSYGGISLSLGGSDATPAFDLSDATSLPIIAGTTGTLTVARGGTGATTASGARTNLNVDVAGTDNSTDVTLVTTSHDYLSLSGQAVTLGQIDISDDTNLVGGTGITLTGDTLSTTDSEIVHDNLSGFVSNEHIDHSTVSITAGTGLSGGGDITSTRTLTTDDSAIVHDNLSGFVANEHIDHSGVSITAGAGLTGGGDITATRDIAVGAGTGVTVNADDIAIGQDVGTNADVTFNSVTSDDFIGSLNGAVQFEAKATVALNKGDAVYVVGISGNTPTIAIADSNDAAKMPSFGLAASSASINDVIGVVTFGTLKNINTSSFSEGDVLFISSNGTSGNTLTATKEAGESVLCQNIGKVIRSHATVGSIKVGGAGRANATPNLNDGNIFIGNGSNQAVTAALNTKIEEYLSAGTSTANFDTISIDGTEITATATELNKMDGVTSTTAEINYTDGVTSNIQTQLNLKAPLASPAFTGTATGVNLTLSGDLTVNGSTTTLDTTNLAVEDNLMELNAGVTSNANDAGFLIERGSTGDNAIFMWDESADKFTLGTTTATGTTTGDITLSSTGTLVANVEGAITGDVTGNADTATALATARNFSLTGDVTAGAISFDGSGNVALATTIAANSVALGTDTTGNYMSDLTEGTGIDISHTPAEGSNGTITLDLTEVGFGGGANRLITDDGDGTVSTEANLTFDGTDLFVAHSSGAIKFAAAHATDKIQLYNGGNEKIGTSANTIIFTGDNHKFIDTSSSETMQWTSSNNYLTIHETGASKGSHLRLATDNSDFIFSASGASNALSIYDVNATANSLVMDSAGKITLRDSLKIPVGKSVFFGGGDHTYISEDVDDRLRFFVGGDEFMRFTQQDAGGEIISFYSDVYMDDNLKIHLGNSQDLRLFHDASNSYVYGYGTGNLYMGHTVADADTILVGDNGSGSPTAYLTLDGSAGITTFSKSTKHLDSMAASFGDSSDMQIFHNGSYGNITNGTGNLYIDNTTDNADMYFRVDDAGTLFTAMRIDGSEIGNVHLPNDGQNLYIGANNDIRLIHTGDTNYMYGYNGPLYIGAVTDQQDLFLRIYDGAVINAIQIDASDAGTAIFNQDIRLNTNATYIHSKDASGTSTRMFGINGSNTTYIGPIDNYAGGNIIYGANANVDDHDFYTAGTIKMRIKADGNVGIGTQSPSNGLELYGAARNIIITNTTEDASGIIMQDAQDSGQNGRIVYDSGANKLYIQTHGGTGLTMDSSRNVGIGTASPATTLEVDGILTMEDISLPGEGLSGHSQMFSVGGEMKVYDAGGNLTQISPHNFDLIPGGASEEMAWSYYSRKNVENNKYKTVNVDMMKLARLVEELTGEKLVYIDEQ
jgi:hypothetical protein